MSSGFDWETLLQCKRWKSNWGSFSTSPSDLQHTCVCTHANMHTQKVHGYLTHIHTKRRKNAGGKKRDTQLILQHQDLLSFQVSVSLLHHLVTYKQQAFTGHSSMNQKAKIKSQPPPALRRSLFQTCMFLLLVSLCGGWGRGSLSYYEDTNLIHEGCILVTLPLPRPHLLMPPHCETGFQHVNFSWVELGGMQQYIQFVTFSKVHNLKKSLELVTAHDLQETLFLEGSQPWGQRLSSLWCGKLSSSGGPWTS